MKRPPNTPIPTWYRGEQYRSKLEACWCAFFHELGIRAEYELDAFILPSGNYTPDFYLPDVCDKLGSWVEVKPFAPSDHELQSCEDLASATGREVVLVWGSPITHVQTVGLDDCPPNCTAFAWIAEHEQVVRHNFPTPVCWWCPDASFVYLQHAAIEAHRAVRWSPMQAGIAKADGAWKRRVG